MYANTAKGTPTWFLDDQSFEKMGSIMQENNGKILALYDELTMFLSQMNVFSGKKITDSHELAVFLQLYGANPCVRKTGTNLSLAILKWVDRSQFICILSLYTHIDKGIKCSHICKGHLGDFNKG